LTCLSQTRPIYSMHLRSSSKTAVPVLPSSELRSSSVNRSSSVTSGGTPERTGRRNVDAADSPVSPHPASDIHGSRQLEDRYLWLGLCFVSLLLIASLITPMLRKPPGLPIALEQKILSVAQLPVSTLVRLRESADNAGRRLNTTTWAAIERARKLKSAALLAAAEGTRERLLSSEELISAASVAKAEAAAVRAESELEQARRHTELEETRFFNALREVRNLRLRQADVNLANCLTKIGKDCAILVMVINEGMVLDTPGLKAARDTYCRVFRCAFVLPTEPSETSRLRQAGQVVVGDPAKVDVTECSPQFRAHFEQHGLNWRRLIENQYRVLEALTQLTTGPQARKDDWVITVTTHSFVLPANMVWLLAQYNPNEAHWIGDSSATAPRGVPKGYICGQGGGVLSRGAIEAMKLEFNSRRYVDQCMRWEWMVADIVKPIVRRGDMQVSGFGCSCSVSCRGMNLRALKFFQDTDYLLSSRYTLTPVTVRYSSGFPVTKALKVFKKLARSSETPFSTLLLE